MAKLGQQVQAQQEAQQQSRPTRSQRLAQQEEIKRFEAIKQRAKEIQEERFKDKVVTYQENYSVYRPKKYSEKEWDRMRDETKQAILRQYERGRGLDYYAEKGELVKTTKTRNVSKTIPFTLDEGENSYEKLYGELSPDLKQFFTSPETLKQERTERIKGNITKADERIAMAKTRLVELDQKYRKEQEDLRDWWNRKSSKYRDDPRNRENYKRNLRELEDDYEEDVQDRPLILRKLQKERLQLY